MTTPLPVTLIGGYLGAGKTTLVNQLLRQAQGQRLAVLVNEFGALPIDEDLIEAQSDNLISIAGGCICCSFGSDLAAALIEMAGYQPRPDHVIIEASGVALPGAIAGSIALLEGFRLDGIAVLADGVNLQQQLDDDYIGDTIERQLQGADLIVLTKKDLLADADRAAVMGMLNDRFGGKTIITADQGHVAREVLLGTFRTSDIIGSGQHSDGNYESVVLTPQGPVDAHALAKALASGAYGTIRAKGFVQDLTGVPALIQVVGQRADVTFPEKQMAPAVVCIGLKGQLAKDRLRALIGT